MAIEKSRYKPLSLQVKDVLLKRIADKVYKQGKPIPSEAKLAEEFGTSVTTIKQTLAILVADGFLIKQQGKRTIVSQKTIKLSFFTWFAEVQEGEKKTIAKILMDVIEMIQQKHPLLVIEPILVDDYHIAKKELVRLISSGNAPDVIEIKPYWTSYFASIGALERLDTLLNKKNLENRFYEKDIVGGMYRDALYSVAWTLCPVSLIANKNVLREAGIHMVDIPMTLDRWVKICQRLEQFYHSQEKYCYALSVTSDPETDFLKIYSFLQAFQGGLFDKEGAVVFNSPTNVAAFSWLRNFVKSFRVYTSHIPDIRKRFASGDIAFISEGPWIKYLLEKFTGEDFDKNFQVILNPVYDGTISYSWNDNHALAICSQSQHKEYAARFIDTLTNDREISNYYSSRVGHLPVNRTYLETPVYNSDFYRAYKQQLLHATCITAQNAMFSKAMEFCNDAFNKILYEGIDIKKELDEKEYYLNMLYTEPQIQKVKKETGNLIPRPLKMDIKSGTFSLIPETVICVSENIQAVGEYLRQRLIPATEFPLAVKRHDQGNQHESCIILQLEPDEKGLGEEGYKLSINADRILITSPTPAGIFYACQTLLQLLPSAIESKQQVQDLAWTVPQLEIEDKPRFPWRGMHLDVGRHFMPKEFIKKFIDLMVAYKMNVFHWHLTEDHGWRIEIKRYPELTEIGSWRLVNGKLYGGYYTQADICEIIEHARQRYVTIVPEIEMPGHSVAALAAYPELSCTGGPFTVGTKWGIFEDLYCAGNEHTFEFLENVLAEIFDLFPGKYVHIGGDECPKDRWKACPKCQERIKQEGLKNEDELQSYFMKRIGKFLTSKDRYPVGWGEIFEGGLAQGTTVMSWRDLTTGIVAAQLGHDVVMCPDSHCYFDYYQSSNREQEPEAIGGYLPLEKVYAFEPIPSDLSTKLSKHILGAQGNMWTEYIRTPEHAEYMLLPRMCALAEVVWSEKDLRNLEDFLTRLSSHYARFDALGVNYHHPSLRKLSSSM